MPFPREDLLLLVQFAPIAMFCLLLLAALGAPAVAVVSEQLAATRKRVFYDKFGLQLAGMALRFSLVGLIVTGGATAYYWTKNPDFYPANALPLFIGCGAATLLFVAHLVLYKASWKHMKQLKAQHKMVGALGAIVSIVTVILVLATKRYVLATLFKTPPLEAVELFRTALKLPATSALWPLAVQTVLLSLAAAGCLGLVYLLLRRSIEDYGRDYYNFSLRYCAKWALVPTLAQAGAFGWLAWTLRAYIGAPTAQNPLAILAIAAGAMWLLACVLFAIVARSENPLRLKPTIAASFVLLGCGLACQGLMHFKMLVSIPALSYMQ